MAYKIKTDAATLRFYVEADRDVRMALVRNLSTPHDVLAVLAEDMDSNLREAVLWRL